MRWIVAVIIIAIVIFYFLGQGGPERKPATPPPPVATAEPTPVPQAATPAPAAPTPALAASASDILRRMQAVAQPLGVQVRGLAPQPNGAMVAIAWTGDNTTLGLDFIDECLKQGIIRGFDDRNYKFAPVMKDGRRIFTAQYLVFF